MMGLGVVPEQLRRDDGGQIPFQLSVPHLVDATLTAKAEQRAHAGPTVAPPLSLGSTLTFLRRTPWARTQVEDLFPALEAGRVSAISADASRSSPERTAVPVAYHR